MVSHRTLARPYAKAVFELADETRAFQSWSEMLSLAATIVSTPELSMLMKDPNFSLEEQTDWVLSLGTENFSESMQALIKLLGKFKRLSWLPTITQMYEEMRSEAERRVVVKITSAFPMSDAEQQIVIAKLKQRIQSEILLACETDKAIIGGAIIQAGDLVIDGSIRGRLDKLAGSMGILN